MPLEFVGINEIIKMRGGPVTDRPNFLAGNSGKIEYCMPAEVKHQGNIQSRK